MNSSGDITKWVVPSRQAALSLSTTCPAALVIAETETATGADQPQFGSGVLLHQAVQRGGFRAVALVLDRGAIRRPLGLPADGLHAGLPKW